MEKAIETRLTAGEAAELEAAIAKSDQVLRRVFRRMRKDQDEIEQLKKQTRAMLAELKAA
jgi:hypothetical protein